MIRTALHGSSVKKSKVYYYYICRRGPPHKHGVYQAYTIHILIFASINFR